MGRNLFEYEIWISRRPSRRCVRWACDGEGERAQAENESSCLLSGGVVWSCGSLMFTLNRDLVRAAASIELNAISLRATMIAAVCRGLSAFGQLSGLFYLNIPKCVKHKEDENQNGCSNFKSGAVTGVRGCPVTSSVNIRECVRPS